MISISAALMEQITTAAQDAYPDECCGLLAGLSEPDGVVTVSGVHPSDNVAEGARRDRFEVDPMVRFELMTQLADGPLRIVGHYHSHPDKSAEPSAYDLKMAFEPDLLWFIVSVCQGLATQTTVHRVDPQGPAFHKIPLIIKD